MMEQLAERRMQREEEAQFTAHPNMQQHRSYSGHTHNPPPPDDDDYDEEGEDDDEYDDDEYEEDEEDEEVRILCRSVYSQLIQLRGP